MKRNPITWEPRESFIDEDGTINDIFETYEKVHPISNSKKRKKRIKEIVPNVSKGKNLSQ